MQSFFGQLGVLASNGERVQCHLCGRWYHALNQHVMKKHGETCENYRRFFGLNPGQPLASPEFSEKQRVGQTERLSQYWTAENAKRLQSVGSDRPAPSPQWRLANAKAMAEPALKLVRRARMADPTHPAHSEAARAKNSESHRTEAYRSSARTAVLTGAHPLLDAAIQSKARSAAKTDEARAKRSAKLKGKKRSDEQRKAQSERMKGKAGPRGLDGKFLRPNDQIKVLP